MKKYKSVIITAVVIILTALILILLGRIGRNDGENTPLNTTEESTTAPSEADGGKHPKKNKKETTTLMNFEFTVVDGTVFATVMGGNGETEFEDTPELYTNGAPPTAGELIIE